MNFIFSISLRNLMRQKRRNILLGIAIGFGTMILVMANAFSKGITDVLINKIITYASGHISIEFSRNGNIEKQVMKFGSWMRDSIKNNVSELTFMQETIAVIGRAIGNKKNDFIIMVAIDLDAPINSKFQKDIEYNFKMIDGDFNFLKKQDVENPAIISKQKAEYLNLKLNDIVRVRYRDINGRHQAARLTIVGIFNPTNIFMSSPVFVNLNNLKQLMAFGPHDIGYLYINIKNPRKNASAIADKLQQLIEPKIMAIFGNVTHKNSKGKITVLGFKSDTTTRKLLINSINLESGNAEEAFGKNGCILGSNVAKILGVKVSDSIFFSYTPRYGEKQVSVPFIIKGIFSPSPDLADNTLLVNEKILYDYYYNEWPIAAESFAEAFIPAKNNPLFIAFSPEWLLLPRCKNTEELTKQYKEIAKLKNGAITVAVRSMYESASAILKLEYVLKLITGIAVMILFFIIFIGVVNTLRMTIRERTREIGTMRAIGMQKKDVRNSFILETFFLTIFASITGVLLASLTMWALTFVKIDAGENPLGMLLVDGHLHFVTDFKDTLGFIVFILLVASITAYFPARRAANLSAATALRYFK